MRSMENFFETTSQSEIIREEARSLAEALAREVMKEERSKETNDIVQQLLQAE